MSKQVDEITIDGDVYVNTRAAYDMLGGMVPDESIRELGKGWGRVKVGNRYFYRKDQVKLPDYPTARWQLMALWYIDEIAPQLSAKQHNQSYYTAKSFLTDWGVELVSAGSMGGGLRSKPSEETILYTWLLINDDFHLVVMDDKAIAGKILSDAEVDSLAAESDNAGPIYFVTDRLAPIATQMLTQDEVTQP